MQCNLPYKAKEIELSDAEKKELETMTKNLEKELGETILLGNLEKDIRIQTISNFMDFFDDVYDDPSNPIKLHARPKAKDNLFENFNSLIGIKSTILDGTFKYFVGKRKDKLQFSLPCSCIIRDVIPWENGELCQNGTIFFDEIVHMLMVEFVRNGQFTVIPFPMKYLNEYRRFVEKDIDFDD